MGGINAVAGGLLALCENPSQLALLRADLWVADVVYRLIDPRLRGT